jgi:SAM-dependent methyltransferase
MTHSARFSTSSRARLTPHDLGRFAGATLFDRIGRAVCEAACLPRKELYEAWEVARRARRLFRGGRVIDLGAGHGLLAHVMLLLDDSSPSAVAVDVAPPASAPMVHEVLVRTWPRLRDRVSFVAGDPSTVEVHAGDVVVSCHACGHFTDQVMARAVQARARLAVLPCCHDVETCDTGGLEGWMDVPLAIDATRVLRLRAMGYHVRTQTIPSSITPKNRLILASP